MHYIIKKLNKCKPVNGSVNICIIIKNSSEIRLPTKYNSKGR